MQEARGVEPDRPGRRQGTGAGRPASERRPLRSRAVTALLRIPAHTFPIPGWSPIVVERLFPLVGETSEPMEIEVNGYTMRLDLGDYIQRRIYFACHEPAEVAFFRRTLRRADLVVDVGAHVGFFTLLAASLVGVEGQVHAFEPVPSNFEALRGNVALNDVPQVVLNRSAVGAEAGVMTLGLEAERAIGTGSVSGMYSKGGSERSVAAPVVTLDGYVAERLENTRIRLVKVDVEGLEANVLEGFAETLASNPPDALLIEINPEMLSRNGHAISDVVEPLKERGYRTYRTSAFGKLKEWPQRGRSADHPPDPTRFDPVLERVLPYYELREALFNMVALRPAVAGSIVG